MGNIETTRTTLRRLKESDFANMRALESNPLIMKFTPSKIPQTEAQTRARLEGQIAKQPGFEPLGIWVSELKEDQSFVGWFMIIPTDRSPLELGFMIVQEQWNKGLATEVCQVLIELAFTATKAKKISAHTSLDNSASMKTLTKLGFQKNGTIWAPDNVLGGQVELQSFELK